MIVIPEPISYVLIGLAIPLLIWLVKKSLENYLKKDLEAYKAEFKKEHLFLDNILKTFSTNNGAVQERQLVAIDELWTTLLDFEKFIGSYLFFYEILSPSEYLDASNKSLFKGLFEEKEREKISTTISNQQIERQRPYLGETLWNIFYTLRAFQGRVAIMLIFGKKNNDIKDWREDLPTMNLLSSILTSEEIAKVKSMVRPTTLPVINLIKLKILNEISMITSGKSLANQTFEYAQELAAKGKVFENK